MTSNIYMSLISLLESIKNIPFNKESGTSTSGFPNLGNTCYLNSVLHIIFNTEPLKDFFLDIDKCINILISNKDYKNIMVATSFYHLFISKYSLVTSDRDSVDRMISSLRAFKKIFGSHFTEQFLGFRQNDQNECINCLLNVLHEAFGVKSTIEILGSTTSVTDQIDKESVVAYANQTLSGWKFEKGNNIIYPSIISDLFGGQFHERTECINCGYVSSIFSSFKVIELPFPIGNDLDIDNLLLYYTSITQLCEKNKYTCDKCKKTVRARQRITLWKKPKILLLSLKRFVHTVNPSRLFKINKSVNPNKTIDVLPYLSRLIKETSSTYTLYSIGIHHGGINGGHCTSEICVKDKGWKTFDDTNVSELNEDNISKNGYIFGYMQN